MIRISSRIPLVAALRMAHGLGCDIILRGGEPYLVRRPLKHKEQ